jgi:sulfur carrier protein
VRLTVNGTAREIGEGTTLDALLGELGVRRDGTAVALNGVVVAWRSRGTTTLQEGDRLEIIVAVAGG